MGRRGLGLVLVLAGIATTLAGAAGVAGLLGGPGSDGPATSPTATVTSPTAPPAGTAAPPTSTPGPAPSPSPTAAPTPGVEALVGDFFAGLQAAIRGGTVETYADRLAPAVIERYGLEACQATLGAQPAEPDRAFELGTIHPPAPWDYTTDGATTTIPDGIEIDARVTAPNPSGEYEAQDRQLHVELVDGAVRWFTDCGTPLG